MAEILKLKRKPRQLKTHYHGGRSYESDDIQQLANALAAGEWEVGE